MNEVPHFLPPRILETLVDKLVCKHKVSRRLTRYVKSADSSWRMCRVAQPRPYEVVVQSFQQRPYGEIFTYTRKKSTWSRSQKSKFSLKWGKKMKRMIIFGSAKYMNFEING
jgi:hypothetical protein